MNQLSAVRLYPEFSEENFILNVWGDSMAPILHSGDTIICKPISSELIEYGNIYFIICKSGNEMLKFIKKAEDPEYLLLVSANSFYDYFEIKKDSIEKLFLVRGHIHRFAN